MLCEYWQLTSGSSVLHLENVNKRTLLLEPPLQQYWL